MLRIGYNTNGFICHSLEAALQIIADLGFRGVAITLDNYILNPAAPDLNRQLDRTRALLEQCCLSCVIETGARFLLDPNQKHSPTLISADPEGRRKRLHFYKRALDIAARLEAEALSFWSGIRNGDVSETDAWDWLVQGCREVLDYAAQYNIPLAFEPEPGMFVENLTQFQQLKEHLNHDLWGLTLDLGHAFLTESNTPGACIRQFKNDIKNIHIEDMKKSAHEHLQFGEGEMDFPDIFDALKDISYNGPINVELSRHSHDAVNAAKQAYDFLSKHISPKII
ncbi:MAG: sugar phosphate isomerase/epimerase family protein [Desulfobacterales bacterium]|nr:sugar phosphate isomerase/epimerase family protein [Desulfobacterales bacterium]